MGYEVGDRFPEVVIPSIDRIRLAYMTVAMRDPNRVHLDDGHAAKAGLPSVISHGTFPIGYLGAAVTRFVGVDSLTRIKVELVAPIFPGDVLRSEAIVEDVQPADGCGPIVWVQLSATKDDGTCVAHGHVAFRKLEAS